MKIAVMDDYPNAFRKYRCFARLKDHEVTVFHDTELDPEKLAARLQDMEAIVLTQERSSLSRAVIEKIPKLRLIAQTGNRTTHIDVAACTEHGIAIAADAGPVSYSTSELTWALILASVRHIPHEVEQLKRGAWITRIGSGLHGRTLGIYALGKIGTSVAQVGKAFGMKVTCWGRAATRAKAHDLGYEVPASRDEFFATADVLSLHITLNKDTRGIVSADDLARMKPSALLVNTSRAGLIQQGALVEALKKGRPGFAAVDVYEREPVIGGDHPLLKMPNVICTPHIGYVEDDKLENAYKIVVDSLLAFAHGKPVNIVNPEALRQNLRVV